MRKLGIGIGIILGLILAAIFAWNIAYPSETWRYKMIVTVETPEGVVQGSAVRQMGNDAAGSFIPEVGNPADVRGEAVAVDLGKRGVLFALISHQSDLEFYNAFPIPGETFNNGGSTPEGIRYYASLPVGTKGTLNPVMPPGYPKLVTFTDIGDPKSVVEAQVWERQKNGMFFLKEDRMEQLFGQGVHLKNITLEITDEPVTWGMMDGYLPWLNDLFEKNARLNGNTSIAVSTNEISDNLGPGSFSQGETE